MPPPSGFTYEKRGNEVVIRHRGQIATVLRKALAEEFLSDVLLGDEQELMARVTGNYKRGSERTAASHPRNRHR